MNLRYTKTTMKEMGFKQLNTMNCFVREDAIISYGLVVAVKHDGKWYSCDGLHNCSNTTQRQILKYTGHNSSYRKSHWKLVSEDAFKLVKSYHGLR